jgi:RNA-directed DNA polymerase
VKTSKRQSKSKVSTVPQTAKQDTEAPQWVETSIWTQRMLTALENGVKGGKWFSLIDKVYRLHTTLGLAIAYNPR